MILVYGSMQDHSTSRLCGNQVVRVYRNRSPASRTFNKISIAACCLPHFASLSGEALRNFLVSAQSLISVRATPYASKTYPKSSKRILDRS
jgi:hypothetical protein